ncbi:M23 family metallopeptidase [candidate division WS5 bacterium]|uniref:M23 family metallopeptidase n=1 Tax=candidate division WS5 bacterium TaxID=2093353 RepID=A0A419DAU8_9BACT|nr:MAG: M23 family metallopeptidase [candidate division WS5 bacterium]
MAEEIENIEKEDGLKPRKFRLKRVFVVGGFAFLFVLAGFLAGLYYSKKQERRAPARTENTQPINTKAKFEVFPARLEDFVVPPKMYGLWPYGIKGKDKGSHNEGHPGWDLELKKGSKLYAISDLRISQIHDGDHQDGSVKVKVIEAGAVLDGKNYHITYHSVINIPDYVKEGATVKAGEVIAEVGFPLSETSAMIHFGIFPPNDSVGACPSGYFSDELQLLIKKMVALSRDMETGKPYESACMGKINKEIYYSNYPDQVQHLGGAEQWE